MLFSIAQVIPGFLAYFFEEKEFVYNFIFTGFITFLIGCFLFFLASDKNGDLRTKDGFIITIFFWTVLGFFGSIPFYLANLEGVSYIDSLFESISGLTTTGATVLVGLDEMPRSLLFYRQLLQWLGGMGIIVLAVAVLPLLGVGGMQLYKAETPGPLKDSKLTPRITETAKALWFVYVTMTVACSILYKYFGMNWFDAVSHAFSTISIGGFSTHDKNFAFFDNSALRWTAIVFMVISGVNFALHSAGWMEGGLVADYAKLILDADQLMMIPKLVDGIDLSEQGQAMDALRETGPGQHFLGSAHTQANFEDAFWRSEMADNTTYEQWSSEGGIDSAGRARKKFANMLESYVAPEIDPAVDEALRGFIAKRMEELPDADY